MHGGFQKRWQSPLCSHLCSPHYYYYYYYYYYCLCPAGEDYAAESGSGIEQVIFNPGSTEFTYTVTLVSDNVFEGRDELLTVGLRATGAGGVVISQARFTLTIIEDDSRSHDMSHDTF